MILEKGYIVDSITPYVKKIVCLILLSPIMAMASCGQVARIEVRVDDGRPDNTFYIFPSQRYCGVDSSQLTIHSYDGDIFLNTVIDTVKTGGVSISGTVQFQGKTRGFDKEFSLSLGKRNKETIFIHSIPLTFHFEKIVNVND